MVGKLAACACDVMAWCGRWVEPILSASAVGYSCQNSSRGGARRPLSVHIPTCHMPRIFVRVMAVSGVSERADAEARAQATSYTVDTPTPTNYI